MRGCAVVSGLVSALLLFVACSDDTLKAPRTDGQFDDADEPVTPSPVGAADAMTVDAEATCSTDNDCPPKAPRCFFPKGGGCGAVGQCLVAPAQCQEERFCTCDGGSAVGCAPTGFATVPIAPGAICPEIDAGPPDAGPADARTEGG